MGSEFASIVLLECRSSLWRNASTSIGWISFSLLHEICLSFLVLLMKTFLRWTCLLLLLTASGVARLELQAEEFLFDLVIQGGRVLDPESGLDAIRDIGLLDGGIAAVSETPLNGREIIDARGLVVAPGFIDLHQHAFDEESIRLKALDGVTSILELETGTAEVQHWYREREGTSRLHHGVSIGHMPVRMKVMGDLPSFLPKSDSLGATQPASLDQLESMRQSLRRGLEEGAVAVGFGIAYTPAATDAEIRSLFAVAAEQRASCHVHLRGRREAAVEETRWLAEVSAATGAPLHIVHMQATGGRATPELLRLVEESRSAGLDLTCEVYPWTAGMTEIQSHLFNPGWEARYGIGYEDLQWGATGERLNAESFARFRRIGGLVIVHSNTEATVTEAVAHRLTMIASDGLPGHPRNAGTYAKILGHYVRERGVLDLRTALTKMSLMPAQRLEARVPDLRKKGRIQVGCHADLVIFDAATVGSPATYERATQHSQGIAWVLVGGVAVVREGQLVENVRPGRAIRAPRPADIH